MSPRAYIDSSAFAKLLVDEPESEALCSALEPYDLYASDLLETEIRRMASRNSLSQEAITTLLQSINLVELDRASYREAGLLPGDSLRSLDALHLIAAIRMDLQEMFCYDNRMTEAAHSIGLAIHAPS